MNLIVVFDADLQLNKALLLGLLTEERITSVLGLPEEAQDWIVVISEACLRENHLWSHVEQI